MVKVKTDKGDKITLEVAQHLGLDRVRCIAMQDTATLSRGMEVNSDSPSLFRGTKFQISPKQNNSDSQDEVFIYTKPLKIISVELAAKNFSPALFSKLCSPVHLIHHRDHSRIPKQELHSWSSRNSHFSRAINCHNLNRPQLLSKYSPQFVTGNPQIFHGLVIRNHT